MLGIVAVPMMKDLNLSPSQFGLVASSFFSLYSISGIAVGFLANRFNTKWIITGLALIWAVTQFPIAWWPTLPMLVACRVILGIGEGPAYPVAIHAAYKWFPDSRRNLITAIIAQGGPAGVVVAAPILSYLLVRFGWQSAFIALGVAGLLWTAFWLALVLREHKRNPPSGSL
ncbi:major facilitator transporter [Caballeronia choica]|uniref:Major facilitator transporter n=1 Tax=Caballeronia choica TaxID=326476 RepID=A0A158L651_9BURK|nr:major facilitator transporter [Caballeronia choica]